MARRIPRRGVLIGGGVVALVALVVAAVGFGGGSGRSAKGATLPPATAVVKKGTLTQTQSVGGILSYGEPKPLVAPTSSGVVTWLAAPGAVVAPGQPVYKVDNQPVVLVTGTVAAYRTLHAGDTGADVHELEATLAGLGFGGFTVDDTFDAKTGQAVQAWQAQLGLPQTGTVAPGQILVASGPIRIASLGLAVGNAVKADHTVLTYSGTTRVVTIPLDVDQQQFVKQGDPATIALPDGKSVKGTVISVGKVAQTIKDKNVISVVVSIADQHALGTFDSAPVTLQIVTGKHAGVLIVPISALLALPGGGYGLQVVKGDTAGYVAVQTGMFANGMVEVSGPDVAEGLTVGVAK